VSLTEKQRHKNKMAEKIFRADQDPQRVVVLIIIIITVEKIVAFLVN
jgi:hypothetical protein